MVGAEVMNEGAAEVEGAKESDGASVGERDTEGADEQKNVY